MALSIRNPEVEALARTLAQQCGESMTEVIGEALSLRLETLTGAGLKRRDILVDLARECATAPDLDLRSPEDILGYDGAGGFDHGDR